MIGVIVNLNAKGVARDPGVADRLAQIGADQTMVVATQTLKEMSQAVRRFADAGVAVVAGCGGDGTNLAILTEMLHVYGAGRMPRFAILRGGTINTVARNLGIGGSPDEILTRIVACRTRGVEEPVERRPLLRANELYGFMFGAAMASRFFEAYYSGGRAGVAWASLLAMRITGSALLGTQLSRWLFEPVEARVTAEGTELPNTGWTLLVAATVPSVGLGIRITYRALEREGHFHLVASGLPPVRMARQFHRTFIARSLVGPAHFDLLPGEATIEFARPRHFIMDGDLYQASRVELRQGPTVELCVP